MKLGQEENEDSGKGRFKKNKRRKENYKLLRYKLT
jgi:hypothetical protein